MKINPDGTVNLEKGEFIPFVCPKCKWPIEYDAKIVMVNCFHCKYIGPVEEFSPDFTMTDKNGKTVGDEVFKQNPLEELK